MDTERALLRTLSRWRSRLGGDADRLLCQAVYRRLAEARGADPLGPAPLPAALLAELRALDLSALPAEALGTACEHLRAQAPAGRKAAGVYYTPAAVVAEMVSAAVGPLVRGQPPDDIARLRILDPACGAGSFLLGVYRLLLAACPASDAARLLRGCVFGVDLDPLAVEVAQQALWLVALEAGARALPDLSENIRRGDTLTDPAGGRDFDVVIGNPPYLSYAGRQAVALPQPVRDDLGRRLDMRGWPTAHGAFIQHSSRALVKRRLSFLVPAQVGHLPGYAPTRRVLRERLGLERVQYLGDGVFSGAVAPTLYFVADADHSGPTTIVEADGTSGEAPIAGDAPWRPPGPRALLAQLQQGAWRLPKGAVGDPGVHTGNCAKKLIFPPGRRTGRCVDVLEGRDIQRWWCPGPKKLLRLDHPRSGKEYFRIGEPEKYASARYVLRQTASHPIVAPRRGAVYFRNTLLALFEPPGAYQAAFVAGVLNSLPARFAYGALIREAQQRAFPQVKVSSIRALPLPTVDFRCAAQRRAHDRVCALVAALEAHAARGDRAQVRAAEGELDAIVAGLYGVSGGALEEMRGWLRAWGLPGPHL